MLNFGSSPNGEHFIVLFDLGSDSIGAGIAHCAQKGTKLLWQKRISYGYQSVDDFERYVRTMYATLLEAGMKAIGEGFKEARKAVPSFKPQHLKVYCVLSHPWFYATVRRGVRKKEKPFYVTNDLLQEIIHEEYSSILRTSECSSWLHVMGTPRCLESFPDVVKIEGYPVNAYERRTARELSVQVYYSIVSQVIEEHIEEVMEKVFPNQDVEYATSTRVFSCSKQDRHRVHTQERTVYMEITGEMTGTTLTKKGVIMGSNTVPLGTNHILRAISPRAASPKEARSPIDVLRAKRSEALSFELLPEVLQQSLREWQGHVSEALRTVSHGITPPLDTMIIADSYWYSLYAPVLSIPWEMPGIRKEVPLRLHTPFEMLENGEGKKITKAEEKDVRLMIIARQLQYCVHTKGVCYTI